MINLFVAVLAVASALIVMWYFLELQKTSEPVPVFNPPFIGVEDDDD